VLEVARVASADQELSELMCVALALGFDKRGRGGEGARAEQVLADLAKLHAKPDGSAERPLSPEGTAFVARRKAWTSWLPLWVSSLAVAAVLAVLYFGLILSLGAMSDRVYARMVELHGPTALAPRHEPAAAPRLAGALAQQVTARDAFVRDELDRSVVLVSDEKLFETGGVALRPEAMEVLRPVAAALQATPGRIQVIGHTDGTAPHSARHPSDWDLSVDRARAVHTALRDLGIEGSRVTFDGRADIEPIRDDDPARSVSGNGRIEIQLLVGR
jgi:type VI secretion system protein ImpK